MMSSGALTLVLLSYNYKMGNAGAKMRGSSENYFAGRRLLYFLREDLQISNPFELIFKGIL